MNVDNETIKAAKLNCIPIIIYTNNGNLLKTSGIDDEFCFFDTIYYLPLKETPKYYVFKLLVLVKFCTQLFFKQTKTTVLIKKSCILGTLHLYDVTIDNHVVIHEQFDDCIKGHYRIAKGFQETIIWKSNTRNYTGEANLEYDEGDEAGLTVTIEYINNYRKNFQLLNKDNITINLNNVHVLKVAKKYAESKASGQYSITVSGELTKRIKL